MKTRACSGWRMVVLGSLLWTIPALAETNVRVRFGIVTDIHYADRDSAGSRFYRESAAKMTEFVTIMNREKPDFVIELGDFKDQDTPPVHGRTLAFLKNIETIYAVFQGPRYHVLGNHDMDSLSKVEFTAAVVNTGIPAGNTYYSFSAQGIHCIVLDANHRSDGEDYERGNFDWTDSSIPGRQADWLVQDLAAAKDSSIVFVHQQLDGEGSYYVKNATRIRKILEESGKVLAVFQGHRHEGAYSLINGIHYYTLKGLIEGSGDSNNAYALVEVDADGTVRLRGFRKVSDARLEKQMNVPLSGPP